MATAPEPPEAPDPTGSTNPPSSGPYDAHRPAHGASETAHDPYMAAAYDNAGLDQPCEPKGIWAAVDANGRFGTEDTQHKIERWILERDDALGAPHLAEQRIAELERRLPDIPDGSDAYPKIVYFHGIQECPIHHVTLGYATPMDDQ